MEDYFVIIVTLIIAVVGILRGKKKKNAPPASVPGEQGQNTGFWDMIMNNQEEIDEESETEYVEPESQSHFSPSTSFVAKPKYTFSAANEGSSDVSERKKKEMVKTKKRVLIEGEEFSLRKAVIYSEIMNRKYS